MALEAYSLRPTQKKNHAIRKQRISYNMAECYRFTRVSVSVRRSYYLRASKIGLWCFRLHYGYAEMLQCQGEYEDAIVAFTEAYQKLVPSVILALIVGIRQLSGKLLNGNKKASLFSLDNAKDLNSKKSDYTRSLLQGKRGKGRFNVNDFFYA